MEGLILLGLAGFGYVINKDKQKHKVETTVQPPVFQNTAHSVYNLNNVADAQKYEVGLVNDQFQRSLNDQIIDGIEWGGQAKISREKIN